MKFISITISLIALFTSTSIAQTDVKPPVVPKAVVTPAAPKPPAESIPAPPTSPKLPAVSEILDKYMKAAGGREAYAKIKNRVVKGKIELQPMNLTGTFESITASPNRNYSVVNLQGIGEIIEVFDGTTAWTVNPVQGSRTKEGAELLQTKIQSQFDAEFDIEKTYGKLEFKGIEKVDGRDAYVLSATPAGVPQQSFFFDIASGLLVRIDGMSISPEGTMPTNTYIDGRTEVDGLKVPSKLRVVLPQFTFVSTATEIKHNVEIDDAKFTKPNQ
ncbi:MAG: hypothetical protein WBD22_11270 [Pyrinomonadaceae bacterium]